MVSFLEGLYLLTAGLALAGVILLARGRRRRALWCFFGAFIAGVCAALLYVRLTPRTVASSMVSVSPPDNSRLS